MTIPAPITTEQRDRIVELAQQGTTRNAIAAEVGVSGATVSKYARAAGISFERTKTKAATAAAQADSAARRQRLAARILNGLDTTLADFENGTKPTREIEQAARSLAALGRALGDTTRAAPLRDEDAHAEIREAVLGFTSMLRDTFPENTYGRVIEDEA